MVTLPMVLLNFTQMSKEVGSSNAKTGVIKSIPNIKNSIYSGDRNYCVYHNSKGLVSNPPPILGW